MKVIHGLEVLSSWCHRVEPVWAQLKQRYAGRAEFDGKAALMQPGDVAASQAQSDWFYRRSGLVMRSPCMLNSGWLEPKRAGRYDAPNPVIEAAKDFGSSGDEIRGWP
ncbi:MAG: hypothetical protein HYX71_07280 [Opitutae bacterium]|nr:hypothetical protein [Opitutae bacterium]